MRDPSCRSGLRANAGPASTPSSGEVRRVRIGKITESQDFVNRVPGFCRLAAARAVLRATRKAGTGTLKERYRHSGLNIFKKSSKKLSGPVAQWSELAAHNRLVAGSSPAGPTSSSIFQRRLATFGATEGFGSVNRNLDLGGPRTEAALAGRGTQERQKARALRYCPDGEVGNKEGAQKVQRTKKQYGSQLFPTRTLGKDYRGSGLLQARHGRRSRFRSLHGPVWLDDAGYALAALRRPRARESRCGIQGASSSAKRIVTAFRSITLRPSRALFNWFPAAIEAEGHDDLGPCTDKHRKKLGLDADCQSLLAVPVFAAQ